MVSSKTVMTHGIPARIDSKAVSILCAIEKKLGESYTITSLARETGIPTTEVARYLKPEIYEPRTWEWLEGYKKHRTQAYYHYLQHHKLEYRNGVPTLMVNFSKFDILMMVADKLRFRVIRGHNTRGTEIIHVFNDIEAKTYHNDHGVTYV